MAGVLQFTLGLATGNFLTSLGSAGAGIHGMLASMASLGAVVDGVFGQIEKGAALDHLSKRTGETVRDLYSMEKGFKSVGLSGDSVSTTLLQMQKALGGFNEMGEPTKDIFLGLGLSVDALKQMNAPEQLKAITSALGKLNSSEGATAASKIFGRSGAGDMLQLARSGTGFADAMAKAGPQAQMFARNAAAFEKISTALEQAKGKASSFFAGIAEGAGPTIQGLLDKFNKLDFSKVGQTLGNLIRTLHMDWGKADFGEVLSISLQLGFTKAVNYFARAMQAVIAGLPDLLKAAMQGGGGLAGGIKAFEANLAGAMVTWNADGLKQGSPQEQHQRKMATALFEDADRYSGEGKESLRKAVEAAAEGMTKMFTASTHDILEESGLKGRLAQLIKPLGLGPGEEERAEGGLGFGGGGGKLHKQQTDVNALERIGFFSGGNSPAMEHAKQTATNTKRTADLIAKLNERLMKSPSNLMDTNMANV